MRGFAGPSYEFGPFSLEAAEGILLRDGRRVSVRTKALATLLMLVERAGHVVSKEDLMERVWQGVFVEENNLAQCIGALRKTLGEATDGSLYVETVPGRGYRFTAPVTVRALDPAGSRGADETTAASTSGFVASTSGFVLPRHPLERVDRPPVLKGPETRYAQSGDVHIAYQVIGDGPIDLVFVMGWVSHLDYFWTEPSFARFLKRLASFSRLIVFDKRGTGLSDRVPLNELPTLEERMDDVRAVMDAVGSSRTALFGVSEGGPLCMLFAATYPDRTSALIMTGAYAKRIWHPEYPWAPTPEERDRWFADILHEWGGPVGLDARAPSIANQPEFRSWWATYLRMGASPGAVLALSKMNFEIDVRHVLPSIHVPTLILHRVGEQVAKVEEARYIASRIPDAKLVELPGIDHLPFVGDQDTMLDEIEAFVTGIRHAPEPDVVLATVLVALIDPPAGGVEEDGWRTKLKRFGSHVTREIEWFRGRWATPAGSRITAAFDGPARAIRCANALSELAGRSGIDIRMALHTGECEFADDLRGSAVTIATTAANHARPGEVLVTQTTKGLVPGSGFKFGHWGSRALKESDGGRLFTVER